MYSSNHEDGNAGTALSGFVDLLDVFPAGDRRVDQASVEGRSNRLVGQGICQICQIAGEEGQFLGPMELVVDVVLVGNRLFIVRDGLADCAAAFVVFLRSLVELGITQCLDGPAMEIDVGAGFVVHLVFGRVEELLLEEFVRVDLAQDLHEEPAEDLGEAGSQLGVGAGRTLDHGNQVDAWNPQTAGSRIRSIKASNPG